MTDSGKWILLTPDNEVTEIEVSLEKSPQYYVEPVNGVSEVFSHFVYSGVWMTYNKYEEGQEERVNHCATALWNFRDPAAKPHLVYGPVVMAGSISHCALTVDNLVRLTLLARLAQTETEKKEELGLLK